MYKLLTTTAVILAVATPSLANEWTDGKKLTTDLETIYQNLDGQGHFDTLQGNTGELNLFFNEVDKGVTHLTLTVETDNTITAGIVGGSSFTEIETRANNLINRINYDLFVETGDTTYDVAGNYGVADKHTIDGNPADKGNNDYLNSQTAGLLGVKTTEIVGNVNTFNDGLLSNTLTTDARTKFTDEFNVAGTGEDSFNGVSIAGFKATLGELNTAITTANGVGNSFFGNIEGINGDPDVVDDGTFNLNTVNNFIIPSYNNFESIGDPASTQGFTSISDWANGYETVVAGADQYRYEGVGVATSDGTTISIDGTPVTDLANTAGLTKVN